ncbi:MAG: hypothetical protein FGM27_06480 [Candidatus Omnitrophica bacterium]|nr:hypothetical protein [Candidatus Omnitrophota bacterium]
MNKIADAWSTNASGESAPQGANSVFVNTVDEKLRPRSRYEALASVMMVLRPLVLLASVAVVLVVFSYGVRQGMKIEKAIANTPEEAAAEAAPELPPLQETDFYLPDAPPEGVLPEPPALEGAPDVTVEPVAQAALQPVLAAEPAAAEGKYTVQLITYAGQAKADEEVAKLKKQGYTPFIIPSGRHRQVCINRFPTKEAAADFLKDAEKDGLLQTYPGAYVRASKS